MPKSVGMEIRLLRQLVRLQEAHQPTLAELNSNFYNARGSGVDNHKARKRAHNSQQWAPAG